MKPYVKHGHRVSLLPLAAMCGAAGKLSEQHGAGRPAAMSTAFHAWCAGDPRAPGLLALLTDEERREVEGWQKPGDVVVGNAVLRYENADKELAVGLDDWGFYVDPMSGEDCLTIGHLDFGWVMIEADGTKTAYVCDVKKSFWTTVDGPESLQLHAYARAYALKHDCDRYCTGLWIAEDGEWLWSKEMVELSSPRAEQLWDRISAAASNSGEFTTGAHCRGCYARLHCPEHVMPATLVDSWLSAALVVHDLDGNALYPSDKEALDLLLKIEAVLEVAKKAKEQLQAMVDQGKVHIEQDGRVWGMIEMPGRESLDKDKLLAAGIDPSKFVKRGKPYPQFRWLKKAG